MQAMFEWNVNDKVDAICELCGDKVIDFAKIPRGGGCYDRVCRECFNFHDGDLGMIEEAVDESNQEVE